MSSDIDVLKLEMRPFIKRSFATGPGNVAGTTLVDATLVEAATFWDDCWVLLRTGDYAGELRRVTASVPGTLTLDHSVGGLIAAGVQYVMLPTIPVTVVTVVNTLEQSPTEVIEGQVTLTGAAQQLPDEPCKSVTIENPIDNAVVVWGHDNTLTLLNGYRIWPGATFSKDIDNVNKIWVIGTADQIISYGGVN